MNLSVCIQSFWFAFFCKAGEPLTHKEILVQVHTDTRDEQSASTLQAHKAN